MAAAKRKRKKSYIGKAVAVFMVVFTAVVGVSVYGQTKEDCTSYSARNQGKARFS